MSATHPLSIIDRREPPDQTVVWPEREDNQTGEDTMPIPRRPQHESEQYDSERMARLERLMDRLVERESERPREAGRSVDTLRRDIGIFAILMGMMVQTGAAFYWAGGMSKQMEAQKEVSVQIQAEQAYQRAQNQVTDGEMKASKARQEERDKKGGR